MAKCKICGKAVVTAHVFHRECWQEEVEKLAQVFCDNYCRWPRECPNQDELEDKHCDSCDLIRVLNRRLTMHKTPRQFCAAGSLPESASPLPGQSADAKSLPIPVPPPKHFLVVCSDSKRPCFRKPPDPYRNMWPLCLVFRRPQIDTIFQARFL